MKITIYELLGLVKDGKAPKKIKVYGKVYINNNCNCYLDEKDKSLCTNVEIPMFLNDEVEIIEEKKKIPEKLDVLVEIMSSDKIGVLTNEIGEIQRRFNQLLDYLKSKGE